MAGMSSGDAQWPRSAGDEQIPDENCVVALYDFDPSTIEWPFRRQRPLALQTGRVIQVIHDDGSEWALGQPVGGGEGTDTRGYFPKNYTVTVADYREMMKDYQEYEAGAAALGEEGDDGAPPVAAPMDAGFAFPGFPPEGQGIAVDDRPQPDFSFPAFPTDAAYDLMPLDEGEEEYPEYTEGMQGVATDGPGMYDVQDPEPTPGSGVTHDLSRSQVRVEDPPVVPKSVRRGDGPKAEDMAAALAEAQRDIRQVEKDPYYAPAAAFPGSPGHADSRSSTPATQSMTRPDRDFVRRHLPMELQDRHLKRLSEVESLCNKNPQVKYSDKPPFPVDSRVRATTCRTAHGVEPPHLRIALLRGGKAGARLSQMFRPGFNDIVNESFKAGCNSCILSKLYLTDAQAREQFQRIHVKDVHGTMWFELQRRKEYLFYQKLDYVDVMMHHPDAWGFPDTSLTVSALPGEPFDPMHGWFYQKEIDTEKEMNAVEFRYQLRMRCFPADTFQAIALGKVPEFLKAAGLLNFAEDEEEEEGAAVEEVKEDATQARGRKQHFPLDQALLDGAGLGSENDDYRTVEELDIAGTVDPPDVLDAKTTTYSIRGIPALRIYLRTRSNPDNTKQTQITPKLVKDMAAQLGIHGQCKNYWYCLFALRYPLSPEWEVFCKSDTRWYLHLPTSKVQCLHPMITRFREHMDDSFTNEFLWDFRGFVTMKCSDCGIPDSVVWCMQCTDYFCSACFFKSHKSEKRGKKHWPMPIPGSRYLMRTEVEKLREHLPLLNVGFSNRRRFLATENQSDKNGSRSGDTWLFFSADTFSNALVQAPRKHWILDPKRANPPRLAPDAEGYYYNFQGDVLADKPTHIMTKQHEQKALSLLQRNIRGAITRRRIKKEVAAAEILQKCKVMLDARKTLGENGQNRRVLQGWYRKFRARKDREKLEWRVMRTQAIFRGCAGRKFVREMLAGITKFQAHFRGLRGRRLMEVLGTAVTTIQRMYRGHLMGRKPMHDFQTNAVKLQALSRGCKFREGVKKEIIALTYIQARYKGILARRLVARMKTSGMKIQRNWRRFQAQLDTKIMLYDRLATLRSKYNELMRYKIQESSATLIQRNWRRHVDQQTVIYMKKDKTEADKKIQTLIVAIFAAASSMRHHVHPWWRHMPPELQEVLEQIKGSLQRTIALVPVTGKLASEEIGKKGLRVAHKSNLIYTQLGSDPDLASHLFLSVTRHLLSLVPEEQFASTVNWACYAIGHQAASLSREGTFLREQIPLGKELAPHSGDTLHTLWNDTGMIKHHHDWLMTYSDESVPGLILHGLHPQHRQVFLAAQTLITMRQALDTPTLSTEDHLKFQGLDAHSGAQLMEVMSCEMDHRLPADFPTKYGTVASLSTAISEHITQMEAIKTEEVPKPAAAKRTAKRAAKALAAKAEPKSKGKSKAKAKSKAEAAAAAATPKVEEPESPRAPLPAEDTSGVLFNFNRKAMLRIVQQVGYFMRDQPLLIQSVLSAGKQGGDNSLSVRQSRYVSVTDKLFELADVAKYDHCQFVLAVVLFHMALRALCLRILYHRAAISIQKRYRYLKAKGAKAQVLGPAIMIQRFWKGLRVALRITRQDTAAAKIQHSYKVYRWNKRANTLLEATLRIQRVWLGAIDRKWRRTCNAAAVYIQKFVRANLVRLVLNKEGRDIARRYQREMNTLLRQKANMTDTLYIARTSALAGKLRGHLARQRDLTIDLRRMPSHSLSTTHTHQLDKQRRMAMTGSVQPMRLTVFEPMVFALARMEPQLPARYGAQRSRVLVLVHDAKKELDKTLPRESIYFPHAAAKRGRAAMVARRLAKKPKLGNNDKEPDLDEDMFTQWSIQQFKPTRF